MPVALRLAPTEAPGLQEHLAKPGEIIPEWRGFSKSQAFEIKGLALEPKFSFLSPL